MPSLAVEGADGLCRDGAAPAFSVAARYSTHLGLMAWCVRSSHGALQSLKSSRRSAVRGQERVLATDYFAATQLAHTASRKGEQLILPLKSILFCGAVGKGDVEREGTVACSVGGTILGCAAISKRSGIAADNSRSRSKACRMTWWTRRDALCNTWRAPGARQTPLGMQSKACF